LSYKYFTNLVTLKSGDEMNAEEIKKALDYEKKIDGQLTQLKKTPMISREIIQKFEDNKFEVIEKLLNLNIGGCNYDFIPVIPMEYGGLYPLINSVYYNKGVNQRPGTTELDPTKITSNGCCQLHYICEVDLGKNLVKKSLEETEKLIAEEEIILSQSLKLLLSPFLMKVIHQASIAGADRYMEINS
jgi:hypothetical protein